MGVMIPMKRERMLTIRLLMMNMHGYWNAVRVNSWRYGCGGSAWVSRLHASGKLPTLALAVTAQLAAIGNNLNQTARKVNSGQWSSGDRVQVVAALMAIERELRSLRQVVREHGARDDS